MIPAQSLMGSFFQAGTEKNNCIMPFYAWRDILFPGKAYFVKDGSSLFTQIHYQHT